MPPHAQLKSPAHRGADYPWLGLIIGMPIVSQYSAFTGITSFINDSVFFN